MDSDFVRELIVLAVVVGLYVIGSAMLLRGHTADLSAVNGTPGHRRAAAGGSTTAAEPRLNRRRKARTSPMRLTARAVGSWAMSALNS